MSQAGDGQRHAVGGKHLPLEKFGEAKLKVHFASAGGF